MTSAEVTVMTRDQAEDSLADSFGIERETAVRALDLLDDFGPFEVKFKVAERGYVYLSCLWQGKFSITSSPAS